jgi:hypothetical protein
VSRIVREPDPAIRLSYSIRERPAPRDNQERTRSRGSSDCRKDRFEMFDVRKNATAEFDDRLDERTLSGAILRPSRRSPDI